MPTYNYNPETHWLMLVINEFKPVFGLPKTKYIFKGNRLVTHQTFDKFDKVSYTEFIKRYYFFWDFFGIHGTLTNLGLYNGQIFSFGDFKKEDSWSKSTITIKRYEGIFEGKYDRYRQTMVSMLVDDLDPKEYKIKFRNILERYIQQVNRDQFGYITFMNNRMMDLFNII